MNAKTFILASIAGGVTSFILGYLFYGIVFHQDYSRNILAPDDHFNIYPNLIYVFLGNLCVGLLLTFVYYKWAGLRHFKSGFTGGLLIGLLMALADNFVVLGRTDLFTLSNILVDAMVLSFMTGISGGVVAMILNLMTAPK